MKPVCYFMESHLQSLKAEQQREVMHTRAEIMPTRAEAVATRAEVSSQ